MDSILAPLEWVVSYIMVGWHWVFSPVFGADSGLTWTLSIVGLVVIIRILLIPLFVKQIKSSRNLQLLQPQVKAIQAKYPEDKQRQQQEMMKLYKDTGTNPLASCLPILLQAPVFFALFRVLNGLAHDKPYGAFKTYPELFDSAANASILGAPLSATFKNAPNTTTQIIAGVMVALMVATTYLTQRQLMRKNMPASALEGPFAQQQKILLYVMPLAFLFSGYNFPLGVVLYWLVSNLWTMGQQFYVIRKMPAPGTPAEDAYRRRQEAKALRKGKPPPEPAASTVMGTKPAAGRASATTGQGSGGATRAAAGADVRVQPRTTSRADRRKPTTKKRKK